MPNNLQQWWILESSLPPHRRDNLPAPRVGVARFLTRMLPLELLAFLHKRTPTSSTIVVDRSPPTLRYAAVSDEVIQLMVLLFIEILILHA
jgi:hypothetical protein